MNSHREIIQLVIAYTLTGALVFTVIITCLSLVGWIKFQDKSQQKKLFQVFVVQLCVFAVGFYAGMLKLDPIQVKDNIAARGADQILGELSKERRKWPGKNHPASIAKRMDTNPTTSIVGEDSVERIRSFVEPDGTDADPKNAEIIRNWMACQGIRNTSTTDFLNSKVYAPLRSRMVRELGLK